MLKTRPIWIMPDVDTASYPDVTASGLKGYFYEAQADIQPLSLTYSMPDFIGLSGTQKKIQIYRKDIYPKPSEITRVETTAGNIQINYTRKSYLFIKKPTVLNYVAPDTPISTETTDLNSADFTINITNVPIAWETFTVQVIYSENPSLLYEGEPFSGAGSTITYNANYNTIVDPMVQGSTYALKVTGDEGPLPHELVLTSGNYFYTAQTINIDFHDSDDLWDLTYTIENASVPGNPNSRFTTTNIPSWVIAADSVANQDGTIAFIEWDKDLAALQVDGYKDYAPWEIR